MGKSKFQAKAKANINKKSTSGKHPKYYDEEIKPKKSSSFAIFIVVIVLIAGGVVGIGSVIDKNAAQKEDVNINPNYHEYTGTDTDNPNSDYKTDINLTTIDGTKIHLADYKEIVVILYFNYIDCPACSQHSPNLQEASNSYNSSQIFIISINVGSHDTAETIQQYVDEHGYTWANVKDSDYYLSSRFEAQYVPHTVYLAKDGSIGLTHTGIQSVSEIKANINGLL